MRVIALDKPGKVDTLYIGEIPVPKPKKGEVLVKVHAMGLNPVDFKVAADGEPEWEYPHILGVDGAGVIDAVGEGVTEWSVGDRVFYHADLKKPGTFAEYVVTTAHTISRIPESLSFVDAAALPCAGMTAYQTLYRKLHIQPGQTILIHAGAGGVGGFAIQLANQTGLTVITTSREANYNFVKSLGADFVIDYTTEDVVEKVLEITNGRGVDAVLNSIGRAGATRDMELLAFNGQLAHIAGAPDYSQLEPFTKALSFHEIALGAAHASGDYLAQKDLGRMGEELIQLVADGKVKTMVQEVITFEEIPSGLTRLVERRNILGKIVATFGE